MKQTDKQKANEIFHQSLAEPMRLYEKKMESALKTWQESTAQAMKIYNVAIAEANEGIVKDSLEPERIYKEKLNQCLT